MRHGLAPSTALAIGLAALLGCGSDPGAHTPAPGTPDPNFGSNGVVTLQVLDATENIANAVAVQPDGRIIVAGGTNGPFGQRAFVARIEADGSFDPTFGDAGLVAELDGEAMGVAMQADGAIVLAITPDAQDGIATARYDAHGRLDPSFGDGGVATTQLGHGRAAAIVVQPTGRIVAAGTRVDVDSDSIEGENIILVGLDNRGVPDPTFGAGFGSTITDVGGGDDFARTAAVLPDGGLLVAGTARGYFAAVRYTSDGAADESFGPLGRGWVTVDAGTRLLGGTAGSVAGIASQSDGTIVLAGHFGGPLVLGRRHGSFTLARLGADGVLDETFGDQGVVLTDLGGSGGAGGAVGQADDKIVIVGDRDLQPRIARYAPDGQLDERFGDGGFASLPLGIQTRTQAVALQSDGGIVVVGQSRPGEPQLTEIFVARLAAGD